MSFFLLSLFTSCHLWSADQYLDFPNSAAPPQAGTVEPDNSMSLTAEVRDYFSDSFSMLPDNGPSASISYREMLDNLLNPALDRPGTKGPVLPRIAPIVSLDFCGVGKLIGKDSTECAPSLEDILALCRQRHVRPNDMEALKELNLPPEELSELYKNMKNATPRIVNDEVKKAIENNKGKGSADPKMASEENKKRSLPAPTAPKAKKARITYDDAKGTGIQDLAIADFLRVGTEKGICEQKIKTIFNSLRTHAIPAFFEVIKDLDAKRAQEHVDDAINRMNSGGDERFEIEDKKNRQILNELERALNETGVSFLLRNDLVKLGEKILNRKVDEQSLFLLIEIAFSFTGMDKEDSPRFLTLTQAEDFCLELADHKAPLGLLMALATKSKEGGNNLIPEVKEAIRNKASSFVSSLIHEYNSSTKPFAGSISSATRGLANSFSDCFLNVSMQVLNGIPGLPEGLEALLNEKKNYSDDEAGARARALHGELLEFFKGLRGQSPIYIPERNAAQRLRSFLVTNAIIPGHMRQGQKDAQEFFSALLDAMLSGISPDNNHLSDKFELYSGSRVTLAERFHHELKQRAVELNLLQDDAEISKSLSTHVTEKLLSLPIPTGNQRNALNVNDCLMSYFSTEDVELHEWELPSDTQNPKEIVIRDLIDRNGAGQKKLGLNQPHPEFLSIQLKRFDNNGGKIDANISFDLEIDLGKYSLHDTGPVKYQLMGVIFHGGKDLFAGHYWAYVRDAATKDWHLFNDHYSKFLTVEEIRRIGVAGSDRQVDASGTAYMLFYELVK